MHSSRVVYMCTHVRLGNLPNLPNRAKCGARRPAAAGGTAAGPCSSMPEQPRGPRYLDAAVDASSSPPWKLELLVGGDQTTDQTHKYCLSPGCV